MDKLPPKLRTVLLILKDTFAGWSRHGTERQAAALAFYTLFSIAPTLMVVTAVFGWFFGEAAVAGTLDDQLTVLVGAQTAETIQGLMQSAHKPGAQLITAIIGFVTLLLAASRAFQQLEGALNTIWEAQRSKASGAIRATIEQKLVAFSLVLSIGVFVMLSMLLGAVLEVVAQYLAEYLPISRGLAVWINDLTTFGVMTAAFAAVYRILPARKEAWWNILLGAGVTALLFAGGKHAISAYLGRSGAGSAYGASGSLVVLLMWLYYSAMLVLVGAELTQAVARWRRGELGGPADGPSESDETSSSDTLTQHA
jgi:membrane protein